MDRLSYEKHTDLRKYVLHNVERTGLKLGVGSFGSVEEVTMSGTIFAAKIWHEILLEPHNEGVSNMIRRFTAECELMSQVSHPNIVQFMGICFMENSPYPILVMERLHTSLDNLLKTRQNLPLTLKLQVLLDISRGLVHLHNHMQPSVVHRDLTTCNVLLNKDSLRAKIADLGNARMIEPGKLSKTLSRSPGTQVYMPPEATQPSPFYDSSLDIFSFGHLSLYTIIESFPYDLLPATYNDPNTYRLFPRSELERRHQYITMLHSKIGKTHALTMMIEKCFNNVSKLRPTAVAILSEITDLTKKYEDDFDKILGLTRLQMLDEHPSTTVYSSSSSTLIPTGIPELLDIYTTFGNLRRQTGWKEYNFLITDTVMMYKKANQEKVINSIQLSSISSVNAVKSSRFTNTSKFYFEIHFTGTGSPWLLRAYTKEKRASWMKTLASKTSQPVTEVHTESYASLEYVHVAGSSERCEDIDYASPSYMTRELPSIPVSKAKEVEEKEEEEDDDDLYDIIYDIPNQPSSAEVPNKEVVEKEPEGPYQSLIIENVNKSTYEDLSEIRTSIPAVTTPQPPSFPLQQPSASLPSYPPPSQSIQLPSPLPPPLPPDVIDSIPVDPEPEPRSPSPPYEAINCNAEIYDNPDDRNSDQEDSDSGSSGIYEKPVIIKESDSEPGNSNSEPDDSEGYTNIPTTVPSNDPIVMNDDQEDSDSVLNSEPDDSEGYTYIPTTVPGMPSDDSTSVHPAITSPAIEHLKLHPQQGLASRSPDPTNDQLQLLIKQMEHMQEMLIEMQSTYVQHISSPPAPQVGDMPKHVDRSMSDATKGFTHQSISHQSISSPEIMSDAAEVLIRQSTAFPHTSKCSSTTKSESATCKDSDNDSTQTSGAAQHPDPQAQMKEVFRELISRTPLIDQMLVTDEQSDSIDAPGWSRASITSESKHDDTIADLERSTLFISSSSITEKHLLKKGNFGEVYHAKLQKDNKMLEVAIKMVKNFEDKKDRSDFEREQIIMSKMAHPNIVSLYGLIQDEDVPSIILEYLPNGDLKSFLKLNKRPVNKLVKYMLDISMGMDYISKMQLVHRDLAARNVMLGMDEICKVGDFGLLRQMTGANVTYYASSNTSIPIRWMAPESLDVNKRKFSTASDVWSFGIVLWEMVNPRGKPYKKMTNDEVRQRVIFHGLRLDIPSKYPIQIQSIMKACWNEVPSNRPSFFLISNILTKLTFGY